MCKINLEVKNRNIEKQLKYNRLCTHHSGY